MTLIEDDSEWEKLLFFTNLEFISKLVTSSHTQKNASYIRMLSLTSLFRLPVSMFNDFKRLSCIIIFSSKLYMTFA